MTGFTEASRQGYRRWLRHKWPYPDSLSEEQDQVLTGSLLGDGCLQQRSPNQNPYYAECHSAAQLEYLRWKAEILAPFGSRIYHHPTGHKFNTGQIPAFTSYHQEFYRDGSKMLPHTALERLDTLGLAVWVMDDGSLRNRVLTLCTNAWGMSEHKRLLKWFAARWGLSPIIQSLRGRSDIRLRFRVGDTVALLQLIRPHVHQQFAMKWNLDDPATLHPPIVGRERALRANAVRTRMIRTGHLTVGYHTGTIRLSP